MTKFENFAKDHKIKTEKQSTKLKSLNEKMDFFIFRNTKEISMGCVEFINNTFFHFLDTVKVRLQAKNLVEDTSLFFKNRVTDKRKIL